MLISDRQLSLSQTNANKISLSGIARVVSFTYDFAAKLDTSIVLISGLP